MLNIIVCNVDSTSHCCMHSSQALEHFNKVVENFIVGVVEHEGFDFGRHIFESDLPSVVLLDANIKLFFGQHVLQHYDVLVDKRLIFTYNKSLLPCLLHLLLCLLQLGLVCCFFTL